MIIVEFALLWSLAFELSQAIPLVIRERSPSPLVLRARDHPFER